jgi:hypothetical protein
MGEALGWSEKQSLARRAHLGELLARADTSVARFLYAICVVLDGSADLMFVSNVAVRASLMHNQSNGASFALRRYARHAPPRPLRHQSLQKDAFQPQCD